MNLDTKQEYSPLTSSVPETKRTNKKSKTIAVVLIIAILVASNIFFAYSWMQEN